MEDAWEESDCPRVGFYWWRRGKANRPGDSRHWEAGSMPTDGGHAMSWGPHEETPGSRTGQRDQQGQAGTVAVVSVGSSGRGERAGASLNNVSHSGAQRLLPGARRPVPSPGDPAWGQCLERVAWELVVAWALDGCFVCEQRAGGEALILAGNRHTRRGTVPPRWPGPRRQGSDAPEMKDGARRSRLPGSQRGEDAAQLAKDPAVTSQDGDSECRYACEK